MVEIAQQTAAEIDAFGPWVFRDEVWDPARLAMFQNLLRQNPDDPHNIYDRRKKHDGEDRDEAALLLAERLARLNQDILQYESLLNAYIQTVDTLNVEIIHLQDLFRENAQTMTVLAGTPELSRLEFLNQAYGQKDKNGNPNPAALDALEHPITDSQGRLIFADMKDGKMVLYRLDTDLETGKTIPYFLNPESDYEDITHIMRQAYDPSHPGLFANEITNPAILALAGITPLRGAEKSGGVLSRMKHGDAMIICDETQCVIMQETDEREISIQAKQEQIAQTREKIDELKKQRDTLERGETPDTDTDAKWSKGRVSRSFGLAASGNTESDAIPAPADAAFTHRLPIPGLN